MREPTLYTRPPLPPFICSKCRSGDSAREMFVDIGVDTEFEGTIYLCVECLAHIGSKTGLLMPKDELAEAIQKYANYEVNYKALRRLFEHYLAEFEFYAGFGLIEYIAFQTERATLNEKGIDNILEEQRGRIDSAPVSEAGGESDGTELDSSTGESSTEESVAVVTIPTFS